MTCCQRGFRVDELVGVDGYMTEGASRMACLAGVNQSFEKASQLLEELAGFKLNDESLRQCCHEVAADAKKWMEAEAPAAERFASSQGAGEIQIDAGKVNTDTGWRDVKIAVFARREAGPPALPEEWETRKLPVPNARRVIADIVEADAFGRRCKAEAEALGLTDLPSLSVLGDGAEWIWNVATREFPDADQTLDIYHGAEYVADVAKGVFGAETPEAEVAKERGVMDLLGKGYEGVVGWIGDVGGRIPVGGDGASLGDTLNYFTGHKSRLGYAERLRKGESIGSGMVEGTVKQMVNRRLKQTGAEWKTEHVAPLVELVGLSESEEWDQYWNRN
jgi:hypothetical protein